MSMAGRMVRYARRRAGFTQRALAAKSGIPQESIARIERGRVDPRIGTLDRLLKACEYGLEAMPRLGIGIDRTQFASLLRDTPAERLAVGIADDRAMIEFRRNLGRVAE
jgi:transcriptional regulator with XRE-family HTH domain